MLVTIGLEDAEVKMVSTDFHVFVGNPGDDPYIHLTPGNFQASLFWQMSHQKPGFTFLPKSSIKYLFISILCQYLSVSWTKSFTILLDILIHVTFTANLVDLV